MSSTEEKVFYRRKFSPALGIMGITFFITNLVGCGSFGLTLVSLIPVIMALIVHYDPFVTISKNFIIYKPAPMRAEIAIPISQITRITTNMDKCCIYYNDSNEKQIVIPVNFMKSNDANALINALNLLG